MRIGLCLLCCLIFAVHPQVADAEMVGNWQGGYVASGPGAQSDGDLIAYLLGPGWYLRGEHFFDQVISMSVGAEGSSLLRYPVKEGSDFYTECVLLSGCRLYVQEPGLSRKYYRVAPGQYLRLKQRQPPEALEASGPSWANPEALNRRLAAIYTSSKADPDVDAVRVVPFLTGEIWSEYAPDDGGARKDYAEDLADRFDLAVKYISGSPTTGYVTEQSPPGGAYWPDSNDGTLYLKLDGETPPSPPTPTGNTQATAIVVTMGQDEGEWEDDVTVTWRHTNERTRPSCCPDSTANDRDIFFKWEQASNKVVTVRVLEADPPDSLLSVWTAGGTELAGNTTCDYGWPMVSFSASASTAYYVVFEFANDALGSATVEFAWENP